MPPPERGWGRLVVLCVAAFLATVALAVFVQGERISSQERSDRLAAEISRAEAQRRRLEIAVAEAESPERILGAAGSLGMVPPAPAAPVPAVPLKDGAEAEAGHGP